MKILAIGSHPDDIEFGCGGTLYKYHLKGHPIELLILSDGAYGGDPAERRSEQEKAAKMMGVEKVHWGDYKDTEVGMDRRLIEMIEEVTEEVEPVLVLTHYHEDTHQDHRNTAKAVISACRKVRNLLFFEGPTTHNFAPTVLIDITSFMDKKLEFLKAHASQVDRTNIEGLSILEIAKSVGNYRGLPIHVQYAEGLLPYRLVINI